MSQWTHILGIIRYDSMMKNIWPEPMDKEIIVREEAELVDRLFKTSILPTGSEGPIEIKTIITNRGPTVIVTGDLRDFGSEDVPEILSWIVKVSKEIEKTCEKNSIILMLRDGIVQCDVEGISKPIIFKEIYIDGKNKWINVEEIQN